MNLAGPAPRVDPALADSAKYEDAASAGMVQQTDPARASPVSKVGPAVCLETVTPPTTILDQPISSISVAMLRGSGAELECEAAILRGAPEKNFMQICLPCLYDERDFVSYGEVRKYLLVKGSTCFVYSEETDPSPLYAIPLDEMTAFIEDSNNLDPAAITISPLPNSNKPRDGMVTVLLKYKESGKQAYQFTFDTDKLMDRSIPKRFVDLVSQSRRTKPYTASVVRAEVVGRGKMEEQPTI